MICYKLGSVKPSLFKNWAIALGASAALLSFQAAAEDATRVTAVSAIPQDSSTPFYIANRAPLAPSPFMKLPPGAITPRGWLREQLELDARGLVGRLPEISGFLKYEGNGWVDPKSNVGWEELPYWLRGYGDLGYVLKDEKIIAATRVWIEGILANQKPDGYFGPDKLRTAEGGFADLWPHMLILDALHSYYDYSADERIPKFMLNYFRWQNSQPPESFKHGWGAVRWADNLAEVYWMYNRTGEKWLLDLARKIHENSLDYTTGIPTWHNVNLAQGIREPAEFWMQAGDDKFLNATKKNYQRIMELYGQFPGGGFAGDENCRPGFGDPRQGFETCGWVEFMHTFTMMTRICGEPSWADLTEEIAFNSYPASLSPDHSGTHYVTSANSIQLDRAPKKHGQYSNGDFVMQPYKHGVVDYRCCPHNLGMGWPYYTEELWLATSGRGLCASLYAASEVKARVGAGADIEIIEETAYPFEDTIRFQIKTPHPVTFPLFLRVPNWCEEPSVKINQKSHWVNAAPSSYIQIDREWNQGDTVTLRLPMRTSIRRWPLNKDAASVNYGPLTFSLDIQERWVRHDGTNGWPEYEVFPDSPWNYGLQLRDIHPERGVEIRNRKVAPGLNPFTHEGAPLEARVKARRIPGWKADADDMVGLLQQSPALTRERTEKITLIPMGAARLRITAFPVAETDSSAHIWTEAPKSPWSASFSGVDNPDALIQSHEPSASGDHATPRFTWWPHQGGVEWLQYTFDKAQSVAITSVYWFDDTGTGGCRVPESWRLLYLSGNEWKPVENASGYPVAPDKYNDVTFKPVTTTALRIEARLKEKMSAGVLHWRILP